MIVRPAAVWGDRLLTEPAPRAVVEAIRSVIQAHSHEFDAALAPLGYSVFDVAEPSYEVIVPAEECPIFVELERKHRRLSRSRPDRPHETGSEPSCSAFRTWREAIQYATGTTNHENGSTR